MNRNRTITAAAVTLIVTLALLFAVRVEPAFAVAWGVLAGVLWLCAGIVIPEDPRADAPDIPAGPERRGTAIARMAWSLNARTGEAGQLITRRVRSILHHRLLRRGIDTDDPAQRAAVDAEIGEGLWAALTGSDTRRAHIEQALAAIDRLSPSKEKQ